MRIETEGLKVIIVSCTLEVLECTYSTEKCSHWGLMRSKISILTLCVQTAIIVVSS